MKETVLTDFRCSINNQKKQGMDKTYLAFSSLKYILYLLNYAQNRKMYLQRI